MNNVPWTSWLHANQHPVYVGPLGQSHLRQTIYVGVVHSWVPLMSRIVHMGPSINTIGHLSTPLSSPSYIWRLGSSYPCINELRSCATLKWIVAPTLGPRRLPTGVTWWSRRKGNRREFLVNVMISILFCHLRLLFIVSRACLVQVSSCRMETRSRKHISGTSRPLRQTIIDHYLHTEYTVFKNVGRGVQQKQMEKIYFQVEPRMSYVSRDRHYLSIRMQTLRNTQSTN